MNWQSTLSSTHISEPLREWLTNKGSLTKRLQEVDAEHFSINLLSEAWKPIEQEEQSLLKVTQDELVKIRQVYLCCFNQPWVFGKTLISEKLANNPELNLNKLGNNSIGSLLFAKKAVRSEFEFCLLSAKDILYQQAIMNLTVKCENLWTRRSVFTLYNQSILIYEVFLPDLVLTINK
ncbi:MAG: hypothetical protein A3E87_02095 [Gammaproteobacteria bacterium RIFCSPHIGHO2_12_FULL_35_23]|nr:MAG: hypothetical protein A3E87_02095 [Gammaproteobacteria bacterium RIFCSPHIGHO2_12_FULL_35_23]